MDPGSFVNQVVDRCESTNDLARILGERGYPHGSWVSARVQDRGRGRMGRKWQSQEGNLFLSMLIRPRETQRITWLPIAASVRVAEELRRLFPSLDVRIKWPNDLWINGAKLGGLLCEGVGGREGSFIVMGLGLNCASTPEISDQRAVSLTEVLGRATPVPADEIRPRVIRVWSETFKEFGDRELERVVEAYHRMAVFQVGTDVRWGGGGAAGAVELRGKVLGLGSSGELIVEMPESGETLKLYAEDVRLRPVGGG